MSKLFDDASLVMIPSAYKDGKLYSVRPTDGSGDFTFSRGSNLAATRVASSGYIEKGRENLLLQSNSFDTTWSGAVTTTSGQSGYDGTSNAWLIQNTSDSAYIRQTNTTSGVLTASIYAKAGNVNWMRFAVSNSPIVSIYFDLVNGVGYGASNLISHDIEDVGNGWHRYSVSFLASSMSGMQWYPADANNDLGEVGDNILIQDAQLEQGLVATDVITTTTTSVSAGILEDMPRLDYSGSCPSLLLEPQRSNLITQSEYFGAWSTLNSSVTNNSTTSPEGLTNAALCEYNITSSNGYIRLAHTAAQTISFYIKYKDVQWVMVYLSGLGAGKFIDIQNGVVGGNVGSGATAEIVDAGNDWKRVILKSSSANITQTSIYAAASDGSYASITLSGGIYLYGAQAEDATYPTSYIPTYGSSVTRSVDTFEVTGISDLIDSQGGVMLLESQALDRNQGYSGISLSDDTFTNNAQIRYGSSTDQVQIQYRVGGVNECLASNSENDITNNLKIAFKYEANSFKMFVNGVLEATDTSGSVNAANTFDTIKSNRGDGSDKYLGKIKQLAIFPTALTDSECIALTTL